MASDNLITGKWVVLGLYEYQPSESTWQFADPLRPGLVIWDFSDMLQAFFNDKPDYTTGYEFIASDNKLTVNLSYLTNPEELANVIESITTDWKNQPILFQRSLHRLQKCS